MTKGTEANGGGVVDDFVIDPEGLEKFLVEHAASPVSSRRSPLIGAPLAFVADVCLLTEGRTALVVALCIYRRTIVEGSRTVTLPGKDLCPLDVGRQGKHRALAQLRAAQLITVKTSNGRTAEITLRWKPNKNRNL